MRIVVASSGLGHVTRGIEIWAADLGRALWERRISATLCKGAGAADQPFEHVVKCWTREGPRTKALMKWLPTRVTWRLGVGSAYDVEQTTFALGLLKYLSKERADILHVQDAGVARIIQAAANLGIVKTKTILAHGTEESPAFLRRFKYLQQLSPWHLEQSVKAGIARDTWTAIPNFVDTSKFAQGDRVEARRRLGIQEDAVVLLTVSAIKRHHKRIDWLIREFGELRQRNPESPAVLVVAGGWETDTDELIRTAQQAHGDKVKFLVRFPSNRMPEVYRASDVFTLCSIQEMMPIALLEAMASGLPCLTHDYPVAAWMTGPAGQKVDMAQKGALAAAWSRLVENEQERRRLGEEERRFCEQHFGTQQVVSQILSYYDLVLRS